LLRKRLATEKRGVRLREEYRYFFFITNDRKMPADQVVLTAGGRCDQENLVGPQLKGGVHALTTPVDNLVSNWAYMVMARVSLTVVATFDLLDGGRVTLRSWTHHISRCPDTPLLYRVSDGSLRYRGMISCRKRRPYLMVGHRTRGARLGEHSE
jgi:hypothetical protein